MIKSRSQQPGTNLLPVIRQRSLLTGLIISAAFSCCGNKLVRGHEKAPLVPTLVLIDDSTVSSPALAIADGRVRGQGVPADLTLDDLRAIETHDDDDYFPSELDFNVTVYVDFQAGGKVCVSKVAIADEKIKFQWRPGPPLELPIDVVRGLQLGALNESSEYEKSLAAPPAALDRVLTKNDDGQTNTVSGLVESLDAEKVTLDVKGQKRSIPRNKVTGIVFAQPAPVTAKPRYTVLFREGSQLAGNNLSLADGTANLTLGPQAEAHFNWSSVYRVSIRSSRLAYLSDLPFSKEEQTPIVTLPLPAQRDKSVSGGRLQVGVQVFDQGLGVHARSSLIFALDGKWDLFAAKIGLDEAAAGNGDCIFQVLADGKSIFQRRMTGRDLMAADIKLPVTGCQQLTLLVEPGENLDLADHANWCDARLIRNKE